MSGRTRLFITGAMVCAIGLSLAAAQPPTDPEARRTWAAERREKIRQMDPEARATFRAQRQGHRRHEAADRPPRAMEIRQPIPLPVVVQSGKPEGGACPRGGVCSLVLEPAAGEAVVVTAAWSAETIECDDTVSSTPAGGQPIAPGWRCEKRFSIKGKGAGYTAYTIAK